MSNARSTGRRMPAPSVRVRIMVVITLVAAVGLAAVGLSAYLVERSYVLQNVEERLQANLESARFLVAEGQDGSGDWDSSTAALRAVVQRMSPDDNTGAMGVIDGEVAFVPGVPLELDIQSDPEFVREVVVNGADGPVIGTYTADTAVWRYLVAPIAVAGSPAPRTVLFAMAYDLNAELAELDNAAQVFLIASLVAVATIAAVALWVSTRLLRPLRQMRETAERVSAQSLSERLPIHGRDDVSELAVTINAMLDRLDLALDSQRRLLGDVGHEMKTPITIVQGYLEVMDPDDPADVAATKELVVDELGRMARLVQDLAGAASLYGPNPISPHPTDLADLVTQIARKAEGIAGAEVEIGPIADAVADVDAARITQAMLQLAQNAVTHGGGRLVIGSRLVGDDVVFEVRDFGPGVAEPIREEVFERFRRGSADDARGTTGSGLGLDIVRLIARAHGGDASVTDAEGGGALFTLTVPRAVVTDPPVPTLSPTDAAAARAASATEGTIDEEERRGVHSHR